MVSSKGFGFRVYGVVQQNCKICFWKDGRGSPTKPVRRAVSGRPCPPSYSLGSRGTQIRSSRPALATRSDPQGLCIWHMFAKRSLVFIYFSSFLWRHWASISGQWHKCGLSVSVRHLKCRVGPLSMKENVDWTALWLRELVTESPKKSGWEHSEVRLEQS